jgi:IS5 family transposase
MDLLHEAQDRADEGRAANPHNIVNQHDLDARWAKKGSDCFFGYKDHVKCDRESKIITDFVVTDASVHDSQVLEDFHFDSDEVLDLDAGYVGQERINRIKDKNRNDQTGETLEINVCSKAQRNKPLTEQQKLANQEIARRRCRIEHIFGYIVRFMGGLTIRTKGLIRARREIAHKNLAYNLKRFVFLTS